MGRDGPSTPQALSKLVAYNFHAAFMFHGIHVPELGLQQCAVACPSQFSSLVKHHHLREMTMYYDPEQLKFASFRLAPTCADFPRSCTAASLQVDAPVA